MSDDCTQDQKQRAKEAAITNDTNGRLEDCIFVCTLKGGGFGRYVRVFVNSDGKECVVYKWALGYATAFWEDVKLLPTRNYQEAIRLAREAWGVPHASQDETEGGGA